MHRDPRLLAFARANRRQPTLAESMIWSDLRNRRLGFKFRRQHPIGSFIVDFVCLERKLIVELDGWTHQLEQSHERDMRRQQWLETQGYCLLRFDDDEVMADRVGVVDAIYAALHPPPGQPSAVPPSPRGGL